MVGGLFKNKKLDDTKYDIWLQKIQFLMNKRTILEHFMTSMSTGEDKYKNRKDINANE